MKLVQIAGYLGSGKTTLILALVKVLAGEGRKVAVLVNDVGEVAVDSKVMEEYGLRVKDIGGGCVCCQLSGNLRSTLRMLRRNYDPDIVILEPTGMAVPRAIREAVQLDSEALALSIGPTIVLFDLTRTEKLLGYETLRRLVTTQLEDADIVALAKVDAAPVSAEESSRTSISGINPRARFVRLSGRTGEGVAEIAQCVEQVEVRT